MLGIPTLPKQTANCRSESPSPMTVRENGEFHCEMPATRTWHHKYLTKFLRISSLGSNFVQKEACPEWWWENCECTIHSLGYVTLQPKRKLCSGNWCRDCFIPYTLPEDTSLLLFFWLKPRFLKSVNPTEIKLKYTQTFLYHCKNCQCPVATVSGEQSQHLVWMHLPARAA